LIKYIFFRIEFEKKMDVEYFLQAYSIWCFSLFKLSTHLIVFQIPHMNERSSEVYWIYQHILDNVKYDFEIIFLLKVN